jgi:hypothetical protein
MGLAGVNGSVGRLGAAVDELALGVDPDELVAVLGLRDRLESRIADAVAAFDAAELWDLDGATSMTRWLVTEARLGEGAARRLVRTADRLRSWPVLAEAFAEGTISAGQVEVVTQKVRPHHVGLFAEHEAAVVPSLVELDLDATITVIDQWVAMADAVIDREPADAKRSSLHHAKVGDRGRLDSDLAGDDYAVVAEALRLAGRSDDDTDDRRRTRAERDADALVDLCRRVLRDHETPKTAPGRQRPVVNVVIDAPDLAALELRQLGIADPAGLDDLLAGWATTAALRAWYQAGLDRLRGHHGVAARTLSGHDLSPALAAAFLCDSTMRRVVAAGSTILDHGRAHTTVPTAIRDAVVLRDRHCRFRGCRRTVDWCEVHHITHRSRGGTDRVDNCVLLCAYHHHVLHRPGWSAHLEPDGTLVVADPRSRSWATRPPGPGNGPPPTNHLTYGA